MSNVKQQFLEHYLERCREVNIATVLTEIYDTHFIEKPVVKNYDKFIELKLPISKQEALQYDRNKHSEEQIILMCNKLIPKINGAITIHYDEIAEKSKSQYPFELFGWKELDDDFLYYEERRDKVIKTISDIYLKEGIEIKIFCSPMSNNDKSGKYFRRISFRFI